ERRARALRSGPRRGPRLGGEIDALNEPRAPLVSFAPRGGRAAGASLPPPRTIGGRAERAMPELAARESVNPIAVKYVNRLSDHLFVLARALNDGGKRDVLWQPGATRAD